MKKIAIFGTHGSAKTSLVYKLAAFYKMKNKNVTVIHEAARQSPFPINTDVVYQTTLHVVMSQIKKELEAEAAGFEISISDRTPSDAFIYINHLERHNELTKHLETFCMQWLREYNALVYLEPTKGVQLTVDSKRASGAEYQLAIRDDFRNLVEQIEKAHENRLPILKAESAHVFHEQQCLLLMNSIDQAISSKKETL
ncbi:MAG: AAA family ATPase [Parachlamydiales bacterium]|nr:AAA family ATPase [Parachlamydiales bacterium]